MSPFFQVFDWVGVLWAVGSGFAAGSTVVLWAALRFPPKVARSTALSAFLTSASGVVLGTVFFAGQISQAYFTDPLWERALARYVLWVLFSVTVGAGLGFAHSFANRRSPR